MDARERLLEGTANAPTMMASQCDLAYSMQPTMMAPRVEPPIFDYEEKPRNPFRWAILKAVSAVLAVTVGGACAILLAFHHQPLHSSASSASKTAEQVQAPPQVAPAPAAQQVSPPAPSPPRRTAVKNPDPDAEYLTLYMELSGIGIGEPKVVIGFGHAQCDYLAIPGNTVETGMETLMATYVAPDYTPLTRHMAHGMIEAAVTVYCPQYKSQL